MNTKRKKEFKGGGRDTLPYLRRRYAVGTDIIINIPCLLDKTPQNRYNISILNVKIRSRLSMNKAMTENEIQLALARVQANFAIEGIELTDEENDRGRRLLSGEITFEQGMKELIENYGEND
jgi:hypothetical protein